MSKLSTWKISLSLCVFCALATIAVAAVTFKSLVNFDSTDGAIPLAGLVQATDGNFYGTTTHAGAHSYGTVFKITPTEELTTLYSFCAKPNCTDGAQPVGGLVQAVDGNLYGTTYYGGLDGFGTVFKITTTGKLTTLLSFQQRNGLYPASSLLQATDGNLYGTTAYGGVGGTANGTAFKITTAGALTTLHGFHITDGADVHAGLVQATNGNFYGTTAGGGTNLAGTIFSLSVGLGPFVETLPTSGGAGATVKILGNNLTGATSVTFNGMPAAFTIVSSTEITTTVPSGATTGKVKVATPANTLTSNVNFRVI